MQIHNFSALIQHSCRLSATENRLLAESCRQLSAIQRTENHWFYTNDYG